jgi:hypothetical protein
MSKCRKLCSNFWVIRGARDDSESSSATRIRFSRRSPDIVAVLVATQRDCGLGTEHRSGSPLQLALDYARDDLRAPPRCSLFRAPHARARRGLGLEPKAHPRMLRHPATCPRQQRGTTARRLADKTVRSRARHSIRLSRRSIKVATVRRYSYWRPLFDLAEGLVSTA